MKYQQVFASLYSRAPARRGYPGLSAGELVQLAAPLWELSERLGLPQLETWQRKELGEADVPELRPLMLAYAQLLTARPRLSRALGLTPAFVDALRQKEVALSSLLEVLERLVQAASDARLLSVSELSHENGAVARALRRVAADEALPAAERDGEVASFGGVRRLLEERKARKQRAQRRTERRLGPLQEQLRELGERSAVTRLASALGGRGPAQRAPAEEEDVATHLLAPGGPAPVAAVPRRPVAAPRPRWLGCERAGELLQALRAGGAPLGKCLGADAADIDASVAELGALRGRLTKSAAGEALSSEERRELSGRDALRECNLAVANAQALRGAPRVAQAAGTTPRRLEEGCQVILALDRLELAASLLLRDAMDGRTVAVGMVALLHRQAQDWLEEALSEEVSEEERRRLLADFAGVLSMAEQAGERRDAQAARVERRVSDLSAQVEEAEEAAHLQDTVERLRAGEEVGEEALRRAEAARSRSAGRERRKKGR